MEREKNNKKTRERKLVCCLVGFSFHELAVMFVLVRFNRVWFLQWGEEWLLSKDEGQKGTT